MRAALLATSALLAFGSVAPAFAGSCVLATGTVACDGSFATPSPDAALDFVGDDLTLVFGGEQPSSVVATGVDGISVFAANGGATVLNYGAVESIGGGDAQAVDVDAYGDVVLANGGDISASIGTGGGAPYDVTAVDLYSYAGSVFASNAAGASITATAEADYGYTLARGVMSLGDNAYFDNAGSIVVSGAAAIGNVVAIGVQQTGVGFSTLYNDADASILVYGESGHGITYGADAFVVGAFITGTSAYISNAGTIATDSAVHGYQGISTSIGVEAYGVYGFATVVNTGSISAHAMDDSDEASYSFAYGVVSKDFYMQSVASTVNYGAIDADAQTWFGAAISYGAKTIANYAASVNGEGASIDASSTVGYSGMASAVGVETYAKYYAHDVNAGSITAYAHSTYTEHYGRFTYGASGAMGVEEYAQFLGGVVLENSGLISATAITEGIPRSVVGGASATGVHQYGKYYAGMTNSGDILAYASTDGGLSGAFGIEQRAKYGSATYVGNSEGASIVAEAHSASIAGDDFGGRAFADGVRMFGGSFAILYNYGLIAASASLDDSGLDAFEYSAAALAYGSYQRGAYGATLRNHGDILAQADADFAYASAYGAWVRGYYYAVAYNGGEIAAVAQADDGNAFAVGTYIDSPGQRFIVSCDYYGTGECTYVYYGGQAALENDGDIHAGAQSERGIAAAYGAVVLSKLHSQANNRGDIEAVASAEGGSARAVGLLVGSLYGDAWVDNAEGASIVAAAYGDDASATALFLGAYGLVEVDNAGEIRALGDGERIAIDVRQTAGASIYNQGLVAGSILAGAGDDLLVNAAGGVLRLADAGVALGYHEAYGNRFYNYGTVSVDGASSIDMGGGPAGGSLVPALNPYAFYNGGEIDFQDGDPDDLLVVTGDFAGDGEIDVDVSGLRGSSDTLYIDGSVVPGTAATINVALLDLSQDIEDIVPIVQVSGDSSAGNFALGEVSWDQTDSFVSLDFELLADIDDSNATPDGFALGIQVTGLSDTGALAASLPGAMLGLVNAQVGTWRQRMGMIDAFHDGGIALWARIWRDKGGFSPEHHAGFGDGGNFDWRQTSSGAEAGIDFAVTDEFNLGLLLGKSQADTHLRKPGVGSGDIDADTWGIYGTWISPNGFYLDASYRWLDFDAELSSAAGAMATDGSAESFNLELGYAWTLANGLKLEPQFQYTRTKVDDVGGLVTGGGMRFENDGGESSRGRLGLALHKRFGDAASAWAWTPYGSLSAVREFDGESRYAVNDAFQGETRLKGTSSLLELGVSAQHRGWSLSGRLDWQDGGAVDNAFGGQLEIRYSFGAGR